MYVCVSIYIKIEIYITHIKMKGMCTPTENMETNIALTYNLFAYVSCKPSTKWLYKIFS